MPSASTVTRATMSEPGSKFGELLAVAAAALVAGADADARGRPSTSSFSADGLGQDRRARLLGLLGEPAAELRERGDVVAVVLHRRRRRDPQRALRASGSRRASCVDLAVERHVLDPLAAAEEPAQRARVDDGAGEQVRAGLLALLEHGDRHLAEPLARVSGAPRAAGRAGSRRRARPGPAPTIRTPTSIRSSGGSVGARDELAPARTAAGSRPGRRSSDALALRCTSSVSFGTISCRSPTTPRSQNSKIGAFGSLLIATIVPEPCMPTLCWIAPEIPHAT